MISKAPQNFSDILSAASRPRQSRHWAAIFMVLALLFPVTLAYSADQDQFTVQELSIDGQMMGVLAGDFNGDKLGDICIIYLPLQSAEGKRFIGLFPQDRVNGFGQRPSHIAPLPYTSSQFQAVDIEGDGIDEIAFVDDKGIQVIHWSQSEGFGASVRLARRKTIYQASMFQGALMTPFALELNRSPGSEFVIPTERGVAIFESDKRGSLELVNEISLKSYAGHSESRQFFRHNRNRSYVIEPPVVEAHDANGDGRKDLFFLWSDRVFVFFQDETGNFPRTADHQIHLASGIANESCYSRLADCNGDGRPDIVALRLRGGITAAECNVDFYLANENGKFPQAPQKTLTLSQARTRLLLSDVDGDNLPELALPAVELGSVPTIKMMMQRKGDLYLLMYDLVGGLPADDANFRKKLGFSLDYNSEFPDQEILFNWAGDYNGDGLMDLVYSNGSGGLEIYNGSRSGFVESDPSVEIPIPDAAALAPYNLNGDGKSDLVIERVNAGRVNGVWALLSR